MTNVDISHRHMLRFGVKHLLALAGLAAMIFATLQLSRSLAQTAIVIQISAAFHLYMARRIQCYESIFAGAAAAFVTTILIPHASGTWTFGHYWLGMLEPSSMIRWISMLAVGGFVQVQYAHAYHLQELRFKRERLRAAKSQTKTRQNNAMDTEPPTARFRNG
jgi:hypothetical protein